LHIYQVHQGFGSIAYEGRAKGRFGAAGDSYEAKINDEPQEPDVPGAFSPNQLASDKILRAPENISLEKGSG
jgi:hypothetical protein